VEREREQFHQNATGTIVRRYLEVLDDLERALKNRPAEGEGATWAEGIELIYRKLLAILESEGVQPMEATGQSFDPNYHEAISHENHPDHESGQIIEVVKNGYLIGDRVLRPALVRVAQ
jgi:molecular chaperone GrpE